MSEKPRSDESRRERRRALDVERAQERRDADPAPHEEPHERRSREAERRPPARERAHPSREAHQGPRQQEIEREIEPRERAHSPERRRKTISFPERFERWARNPWRDRRGKTDTTRMERRLRHQREGEERTVPEHPPTDVIETADEIVVFCDLPGFAKDDIDVHVTDGDLRIAAERTVEPETGEVHHRERVKRVERTIELPAEVDFEAAEARYENGVLHVTLPKQEPEPEHTIAVE